MYGYTKIHAERGKVKFDVFKFDNDKVKMTKYGDELPYYITTKDSFIVRNKPVKADGKEIKHLISYAELTDNTFDNISDMAKQLMQEIFKYGKQGKI